MVSSMILRGKPSFKAGNMAAVEQMLVPRLIAGALAGAGVVLAAAQEIVPVDTGELRDSGDADHWVWNGHKVTAFVTFSAGHAAFVEFGTGLRGMGTYPFNLPTTGTPYTGSWVYDYKRQNWIGMVAQPYLRPALDIGRAGALDAMRAALHGLV